MVIRFPPVMERGREKRAAITRPTRLCDALDEDCISFSAGYLFLSVRIPCPLHAVVFSRSHHIGLKVKGKI